MIVEKIIDFANLDYNDLYQKAKDILDSGGMIIYPTETCYGVGVDATNSRAVDKLLKYKKRPSGKAISVAVGSEEMAKDLIEFNESAKKIFDNFLPGPITLVSRSKSKVDPRLESESRTLGIRFSSNKFFAGLCFFYNKPITSTSANASGKRTPYTIDHIFGGISQRQKNMIDLIFDAGELPKNPPSTVVDVSKDELKIYRSGGIDPNWQLVENFLSKSQTETVNLGEKYSTLFVERKETLILLDGDLGAGKTHFVKGVARGLKIKDIIKSPTYNYYNEYNLSDGKFIHLDAWRIESKRDIELLGIYDFLTNHDIRMVVEWPSVLTLIDPTIFTRHFYFIRFIKIDNNTRQIKIYKSN